MIVLTGGKEAPFDYCLTTAQYCPLPGQYLAIARHKTIRREIEKPYSPFYPSPFTFSPGTPINTGVVRGEGLAPPFTHSSPYHEVQPSLKTEAGHNRWLNMGSEMISHPKKVRVKGGEGWVKGQLHPSPV